MVNKVTGEYLPCPFCGSYNIVIFDTFERADVCCVCECQKCHAKSGGKATMKRALDMWNTRTTKIANPKQIGYEKEDENDPNVDA